MFGQNDDENAKLTYLFTFNKIRILPYINACTIRKNGSALPPDSLVPTASIQALYLARIGKHFYEFIYTSNEIM